MIRTFGAPAGGGALFGQCGDESAMVAPIDPLNSAGATDRSFHGPGPLPGAVVTHSNCWVAAAYPNLRRSRIVTLTPPEVRNE